MGSTLSKKTTFWWSVMGSYPRQRSTLKIRRSSE